MKTVLHNQNNGPINFGFGTFPLSVTVFFICANCYQGRDTEMLLIMLFQRISNKEMYTASFNRMGDSFDVSGHYRSYLSFVISSRNVQYV